MRYVPFRALFKHPYEINQQHHCNIRDDARDWIRRVGPDQVQHRGNKVRTIDQQGGDDSGLLLPHDKVDGYEHLKLCYDASKGRFIQIQGH
ncbi:hypothetical protein SDC9_66226 [bioreactor metagenome]|uniref:Uncharacterized protein n=1 Tax=bioreactor metagenome TaxID=1076179 RepID=A0A644XUA9_9ZZZZ